MTTKELIRAEVKRLFEKYQESERQASKYCDSCANEDIAFYQGKRKVCSEILSYLDTLPDEPVADCNDLEKEYKEYVDNDPVFSKLVNRNAGIRIARHFAEWMKKRMPLPEDTVIFQKGVEEGKRLMMEGAVAVEVIGEKRDLRLIDSTQRCLFDANRGDWLKIIIVKED